VPDSGTHPRRVAAERRRWCAGPSGLSVNSPRHAGPPSIRGWVSDGTACRDTGL